MDAGAQAQKILANLAALGVRRLAALAIVGTSLLAVLLLGGFYLSRPTMETLYSGLDRDDVASIGSALKESGIPFDVNAQDNSILVPVGQAAVARMTLAEKGLPRSGSVGNELYDKLGSLGLTSFMQDVTRVRAMEGELSRTIQMMHGIKAARVHIVLGDEGSYRRERQAPSASVVVRTDGSDTRRTGDAIRHLVSAAIPNMKLDEVTVLDVDGRLLAAGADSIDKAPDNLLALQKSVDSDIRDRIDRTLAPYLGAKNFQVSVAARLNADHKQTNETIYDPDSRVERSVRVIKEHQLSQNSAGQQSAGVESNLPKQKDSGSQTRASNDDNQKNEELTNYEISSKSIQTTSAGFAIDGLSVAVLINESALSATLGKKTTPEALKKQVDEIQQLVSSAAGLRKDRGDVIKVAVVDFVNSAQELQPVPGPSLKERLISQSGNFLNAGAVVTVAVLLIFFGVRPATKALLSVPQIASGKSETPPDSAVVALPHQEPFGQIAAPETHEANEFLSAIISKQGRSPQRNLQALVDYDEEHAAAILKQWMREGVDA